MFHLDRHPLHPAGGLRRAAFAGLLAAAALLLPAGSGQAVVPTGFPPSATLNYVVTRNGDEIGTHRVKFVRTDEDSAVVEAKTDIEVKLLLVTAFSFHMKAEEVWKDGQLVRFTSVTDDDGDDRHVVLEPGAGADGEISRVIYNGKESDLAETIWPATFWNPLTLQAKILLDPVKGKPRKVTITERGPETIRIAGKSVKAHHYTVKGEMVRELWFGPDGHLVRMQWLHPEDDSLVVFERRS